MAADVYESLGGAVRRRRDAMGMTQAALAGRIGLGRTSVTNIENGSQKIMLHQLLDLARALHTAPEDLLAEARTGAPGARPTTAPTGAVDGLLLRLDRRGGAR